MLIALALAAALRLAQDPQSNALLDGVAVQAGESLVTLSEFQRVLKRFMSQQPPENAMEELRKRAGLARDLATLRLEEERGRDFGLEPGQLERINRSLLAEDRRKLGLQGYQERLKAQGMDALADEEDRERQLLHQLWEYTARGMPVLSKRATQDATIRPGEMHALFEENKEALAPTTVQLRWLLVASSASGGPEGAQKSCEDARRRVLSGEDLGLIVQEIGAEFRDTLGLTKYAPPGALVDPVVRAFAERAQVGDLSEVSAVRNPKTGQPDPKLGFQLIELNDRKIPLEPDFAAPEVQRKLRTFFSEQRNERVLGRAREELRRGAFLWVNPLLGVSGPPPTETPAQPPGEPAPAPQADSGG